MTSPSSSAAQHAMDWLEQSVFTRGWSHTDGPGPRQRWAEGTLGLLDAGVIDLAPLCTLSQDHGLIESCLQGVRQAWYRMIYDEKHYAGWPDPVDTWPDHQLVQRLLDGGLNPWARRCHLANRDTPLSTPELLCDLRWPDMLEQLLNRPDAPTAAALDEPGPWSTSTGQRPTLILAKSLAYQQSACLRVLLAHGCSPHAVDEHGRTALFYATSAHQVEILLQHGSSTEHRDHQGNTAMQYWTQHLVLSSLGDFKKVWSKHAVHADSIDDRLASLGQDLPLNAKGRLAQALTTAGLKGSERGSNGNSLLRVAADSAATKLALMLGDGKMSYHYPRPKEHFSAAAITHLFEKCPPATDPHAAECLALVLLETTLPEVVKIGESVLAQVSPPGPDSARRLLDAAQGLSKYQTTWPAIVGAQMLWDAPMDAWQPWFKKQEDPAIAEQWLLHVVRSAPTPVVQKMHDRLSNTTVWLDWYQGDPWQVALGLLSHAVAKPEPNARLRAFDAWGLQPSLPHHRLLRQLRQTERVPRSETIEAYQRLLTRLASGSLPGLAVSPDLVAWMERSVLQAEVSPAQAPARAKPRM